MAFTSLLPHKCACSLCCNYRLLEIRSLGFVCPVMAWRQSKVSWKSVKQFKNWNERHKSDTYRTVISYGYNFSSSGIECKLIKLAWRHLTADTCYVSATVLYWNLNTLLRGKKKKNANVAKQRRDLTVAFSFTSFGKRKH